MGPGHGMTRLRLLQATMARSLFLIDVALVGVLWPFAWWLGRNEAVTADIRGVVYPLSDLLLLYAMGLYRREAFVAKHHFATPVPMVVGMGVLAALLVQSVVAWLAAAFVSRHAWRDDAAVAGLALLCFTLSALVARAVLAILLRRRLLRRQLLVVGAGMRA